MFTKRVCFFCTIAAALLFMGNGCAAFRELFSDPGAGKMRSAKAEPQKSASKKKKSDYRSRRYSRDPLDALFFSDRTKSENWSKNSNLTDAEKAALRHSLNPEDAVTRREIDRVYRDMEKKRKKRQDDIFGPNPFRN